MQKLKELIKQSWELHVKMSWLKEIDRAYNRYKKNSEKAAKERAEALEISKKLREMTLVVTAKGGGAGKLFGAITNQEIAVALKEKSGIEIDKRKLVLSDPIKHVGTYTVQCKLGYEITAPLTVKIEEA
jgi:large subunit ribosomal protein L9